MKIDLNILWRLFLVLIAVVWLILFLVGFFTLNEWLIFWLLSPIWGSLACFGIYKIFKFIPKLGHWIKTGDWERKRRK